MPEGGQIQCSYVCMFTYVYICINHFFLYIVVRVTGGELFDEIVAREFYSEHDARYVQI